MLTPKALVLCLASAALTVGSCTAALANETVAAAGAQAGAALQQSIDFGSGGGTQRVHTTPDAIAPSYGVPDCGEVPLSAGASLTGGALSFGSARLELACNAARIAVQMSGMGFTVYAEEAASISMMALRNTARERGLLDAVTPRRIPTEGGYPP